MNQRKFRPWGKKGATQAPKKELASPKQAASVGLWYLYFK